MHTTKIKCTDWFKMHDWSENYKILIVSTAYDQQENTKIWNV
jgi:hypothetical protein